MVLLFTTTPLGDTDEKWLIPDVAGERYEGQVKFSSRGDDGQARFSSVCMFDVEGKWNGANDCSVGESRFSVWTLRTARRFKSTSLIGF